MKPLRRILALALAVASLIGVTSLGAASTASASSTPKLADVSLSIPAPTFYPVVDGYRDSLAISVTSHITGASAPVTLTGQLTISKAGKSLATYPITTSAAEHYTWSGRTGGKLVAGAYTVTAKVVGPNETITKHERVVLSLKKLIAHRVSKVFSAQTFFQHSYTATSGGSGCAPGSSGSIACTSGAGSPAIGNSSIAVPAAVLKYAGYRPYTAAVSLTVSKVTITAGSDTFWSWNSGARVSIRTSGTQASQTLPFGSATARQELKFKIDGGSAARLDHVTIVYVYYALG